MTIMDALTSKNGAIWVQPGGPNPANDVHFLDCRTVGDITETEAAFELIRCHDPNGAGWTVKGIKRGPAEPVTFSVDELLAPQKSWLERVACPFGLYLLMRQCGKANFIHNYVRGKIMDTVYRQAKTTTNMVHREEDNEATLSVELWALPAPHILDVEQLLATRMTTAATNGLNGAVMNDDILCRNDCGDALDVCEQGVAVGDSAVAPAFATCLFTADFGITWAAAAADPFAAGSGIMAATRFWVGPSTVRYLLGMEAPAAAQGMVAYTDDLGATWTTVNIGGAAAGHGATTGKALFALDHEHVWLASALGYIYFSDDGGETWTAQESGTIGVTDYNCIHFADENYGVCAGAADVIAVTSNGGETWAAATATGGGGDILACQRLNKSTILAVDDNGDFWYSNDAGVTWTELTGLPITAIAINDLRMVNDAVGWMVANTAGPVGHVLYTFTGGRHWTDLTIPTNAGLNRIAVCDESHAIVVGEISGGTSVIIRVEPQP